MTQQDGAILELYFRGNYYSDIELFDSNNLIRVIFDVIRRGEWRLPTKYMA